MELSLNMGQPVSRSHTECSLRCANNKIKNKGPTSLHTEPLLADLGSLRGCKVCGPPLVGGGSLEGRGRQGQGAREGAKGGREGDGYCPPPPGTQTTPPPQGREVGRGPAGTAQTGSSPHGFHTPGPPGGRVRGFLPLRG